MDIKQAHDYIRMNIPESDGRYFTPEQIDDAIHTAVLDLFNQQYKAFGESQRMSDTMARFKQLQEIDITSGNGVIPDEVAYITGQMVTGINAIPVLVPAKFVTDNFINAFLTSEAFPPTEQYAYIVRFDINIKVYPVSVTKVQFSFLRLPIKAKFGYTIAPNGYTYIYDVGTSLQLDFVEQSHPEIVRKALRELGIAQKDSTLIQQEQIAKANNVPEMR